MIRTDWFQKLFRTLLFVRKKIGPGGPELIWHFGTLLAKNTQLSLSDKRHISGIVLFAYIGEEEIHEYVQYEASMTVYK